MRLPFLLTGFEKPHGRRHAGACVPGIESIIHALLSLAKPAQPAELPDGRELRAPSREELMGIRLITRIPHNLVLRRIQQIVQRHRQLHHP